MAVPIPKRTRRGKSVRLPQYVVLKKGEWHVRRYFPLQEKNPNGTPKYLQIARRCVPETEDRARILAEEIELEYLAVTSPATPPQTLGEFFEYYLSKKQGSVERRTYEHDADLYNRYVKGKTYARLGITQVTPSDTQNFFDSLKAAGVSPTMLRKVRIFTSTAYNQAIKWKLLEDSPNAGLILPKVKKNPAPAMSKPEARRFREACRNDDRFIVFEFALSTAMRPQEYLALDWSHLDLEKGRASVVRALAVGFKGGGFELKDPKTDASHRSIPLGEDLVARLRQHKRNLEKVKKELQATAKRPSLLEHMKRRGTNFEKRENARQNAAEILVNLKEYDLVFPSAIGKPQSRENLNNREMKEALIAAKIDPKRYSLKSLRTTCATFLAEHLPPKRLQQFMGHARIETTMEYYVYVDDDDQKGIPDKFEEALG